MHTVFLLFFPHHQLLTRNKETKTTTKNPNDALLRIKMFIVPLHFFFFIHSHTYPIRDVPSRRLRQSNNLHHRPSL
jgi:hypothetical protein